MAKITEHHLFSEIKTIKDKVIFLLAKFPETKDDDKKLYSYFVIYGIGKGDFEKGKKILSKMLAIDFVRNVSEHEYVDFGSVSRARRKIQEKNVALRGDKWTERHSAGKFFKENINKPEPKQTI